MIDIDVARRLRDRGLGWDPVDGDWFAIDAEQLITDRFMLSPMVVESARGRRGEAVFRFNGTTEWALDSVEQHEAIWIPREDQLREALREHFVALVRQADGTHVVRVRIEQEEQQVRAPHAEDAYAGALLVLAERGVSLSMA